jgi:hypothetical protein
MRCIFGMWAILLLAGCSRADAAAIPPAPPVQTGTSSGGTYLLEARRIDTRGLGLADLPLTDATRTEVGAGVLIHGTTRSAIHAALAPLDTTEVTAFFGPDEWFVTLRGDMAVRGAALANAVARIDARGLRVHGDTAGDEPAVLELGVEPNGRVLLNGIY